MRLRRWLWRSVITLIAWVLLGGCTTSDHAAQVASSSNVGESVESGESVGPGESTAPPVGGEVPSPFEQDQRIGLGARWELQISGSTIRDGELVVAIRFTNAGLDAAALGEVSSLFTARPVLLAGDTPASAAEPDRGDVAPGESFDTTVTFPIGDPREPPTIVFFHGAELDALDATVRIAPGP